MVTLLKMDKAQILPGKYTRYTIASLLTNIKSGTQNNLDINLSLLSCHTDTALYWEMPLHGFHFSLHDNIKLQINCNQQQHYYKNKARSIERGRQYDI